LRFDLGRSLSNGAPVFVADEHRIRMGSDYVGGFAWGRFVVLGEPGRDIDAIQRHENTHVLQHDFILQTMSRPLERGVWRRVTTRDIPLDLDLALAFPWLALGTVMQGEAEVFQSR